MAQSPENLAASATQKTYGIILSSYGSRSELGFNLGVAGYSHDIVSSLYIPLLERYARTVFVPNTPRALAAAARQMRANGLSPIHIAIMPLQDVTLLTNAPNIVAPAWEFPDVPDHSFDYNPQNDWPATAKKFDIVMVGGNFTKKAFEKAGTNVPIRVVPIPTPEKYFNLPLWANDQETTILTKHISFSHQEGLFDALNIIETQKNIEKDHTNFFKIRRFFKARLYHIGMALLGERIYLKLAGIFGKKEVNVGTLNESVFENAPLKISGIVYTSILNPRDGRKNWIDLINSFCYAFGENQDVTLVVKFISNDETMCQEVINYYKNREVLHRCKLVFVSGFLNESDMVNLAKATTFYFQTTKAEGNCLPLMNCLAAGRPGVSPDHSAMSDYFDDNVGFVIESHPEPCAWPHDLKLRLTTYWGRIVWPSAVQGLQNSYELIKNDPKRYYEMARRARDRMTEVASEKAVEGRLHAMLDELNCKK